MTAAEGYTYLREYRYERKFLVQELARFQVEALIRQHPRLFYAPYPPRCVNNLYLDTPGLTHYYDNVHGAMQRRKVRVRWYEAPFGEITRPMLEIKRKQGEVGTKASFPLAGFRMDAGMCTRRLQRVFAESELPPEAGPALRGLDLVLFNRYHRAYYATRDGAFRLTLDAQLEYYRANGVLGNRFGHRQRSGRDVVVELKYAVEQEGQADRVAGFFPFRVTRSSKYVRGMERVFF